MGFDVFERFQGHEQVVMCSDPSSGLRAIIAIHSTVLGPSLGGTRFHAYPDDEAALEDVLHLSRAMTYKNALAGLDLGGGKAVIIGDPAQLKTPELLRAYGRFVDRLGGRYITACDVGTVVEDMDVVAETTSYVTGKSEAAGGAGDSSILTALGVFQGMRACAQHVWGEPSLRGRRVGVSGVGKVGHRLVDHLVDDGALVVIADVDGAACDGVRRRHPGVEVSNSPDALATGDLDVFSPNALGGVVDDSLASRLKAAVVCGGANNQLAHDGLEATLFDRGILYAPDYLVNAGGVIQVADELIGFSFERAEAKALLIFDTLTEVLRLAAADRIPPARAADHLAEARLADA